MIVVLDYGMGNLRSVERAVCHLGFECSVQPTLKGATKLIIPGVGAFGAAMEHITSVADDIQSFARSGQPLLGICLGQQLLFESSEEHGEHKGLGLVGGKVLYFPKDMGLKVPHTGWNDVEFENDERGTMNDELGEGRGSDTRETMGDISEPLTVGDQRSWTFESPNTQYQEPSCRSKIQNLKSKIDQFYFVHSLYTDCTDVADVAGRTTYGIQFASAIRKGNIWATQFHPEKSGEAGLNLMRSFLTC
ncbi:MAG: imidazole glycerol phosphate synthase subunit HisH [Fimbriimonadaceae bacterium]|nr:imidazole glycerol phosphate synthase subunit HisH [Fimbriimonadaceae bacterium]